MKLVFSLFMLVFVASAKEIKEECTEFDGSSYIRYGLSDKKPISVENEEITIKFRSSDSSGLLFYATSKGLYNDHILLELVNGKLRIRYQLGRNDTLREDVIGDGLGDDILSTVTVMRKKKTLTISAFGGQSDRRVIGIKGADDRLDLNADIFVGGYLEKDYPSVHRVNFKGCMFKAWFKHGSTLIDLLKDGTASSGVIKTFTPKLPSRSMNFNRDTYIEIKIQKIDSSESEKHIKKLFGTFEFRTVVIAGTIFQASSVSLTFQKSQLDLKSTTDLVSLPFPNSGYASDGRWFKVEFLLQNDLMQLTLNGEEKRHTPSNPPQYGGKIRFGYDETDYQFIGCIRNLVVLDKPIRYKDLVYPYKPHPLATFSDDLREGCKASDPCVPNPCFHKAQCLHYPKDYRCDCTKNYMKPLCQFSQYKTSCSAIKEDGSVKGVKSRHMIDPDNSGPQPAISVQCDFTIRSDTGQTDIDTIDAKGIDVEDPKKYSLPFSFKKRIKYEIPIGAVRAIVQRSEVCEQRVKYECRNAMLFNLQGRASSRWLSPDGYLHYYWGGAERDSFKCACAYTTQGCGQTSDTAYCNCDSRAADKTKYSDEGILNVTRDLPVYEVQFGKLNDLSEATYTIDKLVCYGVGALGVVTFVAADGWLRLPQWDAPLGGDISFYIKTIFPKGDLIDHRNKEENHLFQVKIHDATTIQVVYGFGTSARVKILAQMEKGLGTLSDNHWHKIHVVRTLREAYVRIDEKPTTILDGKYKGMDKIKLTGDSLSRLDIDLPMFVGAFWRYPTYKTGYIGCMKGFTINGVFHDLANAADNLAHEPEQLVIKGCGNACNINRCPYGKCVERYTTYECDCSDVPFYGTYCTQEIGASFQSSSMHSSEVNVTTGQSKLEKIVLAFSTSTQCSGTLFDMLSKDEKQYYRMSIASRTKLSFQFKIVGTMDPQTVTISAKHIDFCDTARHIVYIQRNSTSKKIHYKIDGKRMEDAKVSERAAEGHFNQPYYFYVGNLKVGGEPFVGCMSGAKFHMLMIDDVLKTVEPIREGVISNYTGFGVEKESCGPSINTPIPMLTRTIPNPTTPTDYPSTEFLRDVGIHEAEDSNWAVLIVVALLMMLVLVAIVVLTIWFVMQHKRDYQILEKEDGTVVGTATVRGGNASVASVPAAASQVGARAPSHVSQTSNTNLSRAKSKSNDVFV